MPKEKKRGDTVASSRSSSRVEKKNIVKKGEQHQQEFARLMEKLGTSAGMKIWSEPDANTLNYILNKKNKKKLN